MVKNKNTVTRCDNKTLLCCTEPSVMLGISNSDKDGDKSEKMGKKDLADYQCDDNSAGGYHNEGGEDQTWHVLMI